MAQHVFPLPTEGTSPSAWFAQASQLPGFEQDESQQSAVIQLDDLYHSLLDFKRVRARPLGKAEILGYFLLPQPDVPRGLYLWGGVGRGKSLLMDVFFAGLPYRRKKRMHFHAFMQDIHLQLNAFKGEVDPLFAVASKISRQTRVLCFDEFHVSDIADAMILGRLLEYLLMRGVVILLTSNYPPQGLYPNGLQRSAFMPAIVLLQDRFDVINLDGGQDHRHRALTKASLYLIPADHGNESLLAQTYSRLSGGVEYSLGMDVGGYRLEAKRRGRDVVWFDFLVLCGDQRSQLDYLHIARLYPNVLLSGVPKLAYQQAAMARRLTWLVDIFYDYRVKLMLTAETGPEDLYTDGEQAGEFLRTASRLHEMQSEEYLALPHGQVASTGGIIET